MRFGVISFLVCLTVLASVPNFAQAQGMHERQVREARDTGAHVTRMRFRPNQQRRFMGQVFMAPMYFFAFVSIHEGSHSLAALSYGMEVDRFEPYPHRVTLSEDADDYGFRSLASQHSFVWGYTHVRAGDEDPSRAQLAMVSITPYLTDIALFTTSDLLLQYVVDPLSDGAPFLLVGGMIAPLIDFVTGMSCFHEGCDIRTFSEQVGMPQSVVSLLGYVVAVTAFWRVVHQFRRVFMERRPTMPRHAVSVAPFAGHERVGIGVAAIF
ncbi:MAG: hypothetical protein V1738_06600 [Patescibacteria group bacterium]